MGFVDVFLPIRLRYVFWRGAHRGKTPFSSYPECGLSTQLLTAGVDSDHLVTQGLCSPACLGRSSDRQHTRKKQGPILLLEGRVSARLTWNSSAQSSPTLTNFFSHFFDHEFPGIYFVLRVVIYTSLFLVLFRLLQLGPLGALFGSCAGPLWDGCMCMGEHVSFFASWHP